jgi:hephaestin
LFPLGIAAAFAIVFIFGSATAIVPAADHHETQKRTYYIAADEVDWNYPPSGINQITGEPFDATAAVFTERGPQRIGTTYIKSLYQEIHRRDLFRP